MSDADNVNKEASSSMPSQSQLEQQSTTSALPIESLPLQQQPAQNQGVAPPESTPVHVIDLAPAPISLPSGLGIRIKT